MHIKPISLFSLCLLLAACSVGPDYIKPSVEQPTRFKEAQGWKIAEPNDEAIPQQWWTVFNDAELSQLAQQVALANQNIQVLQARYRQAQAVVAASRSSYMPVVTGTVSSTRNQPSSNSTNSINGSKIRNTDNVSLNLSWEADVWGRIARTVESGEASLQASKSDIAAARLSAEAELAQNYFSIRLADRQIKILSDTIETYQKSLQITRNRYAAGVVDKADVVQAETLLKSTQVQAQDLKIQRAQLEHAIALLIGKAPSQLSIKSTDAELRLPDLALSIPASLLERRPDIAAAERRVAAANAQIGVAKAAFFPTLSFSALAGVQSNEVSNLFNWPSRIWSLGSNLAMTVFDAGKRRALSDQAVGAYDETVANYRLTVLTAFKEVEDSLVALNTLKQEYALQQEALNSAKASQELTANQYKAGVLSYLDVVTVYNTTLSNERTLLTIQNNQMTNTIQLIKALGGGWQPQAK
jgi:NodT family efflux transporter outer membrane factor (OMF) lipoprotein